MKSSDLILRCYAERKGQIWQAFCIDLNLAAQGDSLEEARQKLEAMTIEYLEDALIGEDQAFADQLLTRRAPLYFRLKFQLACWLVGAGRLRDGLVRFFADLVPFKETIPMRPVHQHGA